jgi:cytoskeletal protein CcmA (bactofilin family)
MARKKTATGVTLIAAGTEVSGDVRFRDQLVVNGLVSGNLVAGQDTGATVVISEEGAVHGDIHVPNVVINGEVEGNVYASARVELAGRARVKGSVFYKLIEMQLGAMVDGQLVHDEELGTENVLPMHADKAPRSAADPLVTAERQ